METPGFTPPEAHKEIEPQLPIIEHKTYLKFDSEREGWDKLSGDDKSEVAYEARTLIERHSGWWHDRPAKAHNNVYSWTTANSLSAALVLREAGEVDLADRYISRYRDNFYQQVRDNVYEDGSSLDFHDRDSIHYHVFNEVAWLKSANYLKEIGEQIPPEVAEKLERSIEFVEPYLRGEKSHLEFVNSGNPRDEIRHPKQAGQPFDRDSTSYTRKLEDEIAKFHGSSI